MNPTMITRCKRQIYLWHPSPDEEDEEALYEYDDFDLWPFFNDDDELDDQELNLRRKKNYA
jgi:hypothetical protein